MRHVSLRSMSRRVLVSVALAAGTSVSLGSVANGVGAAQLPLLPVKNGTLTANWAGYVASTSNVTSVTGTWTVPNAGTLPPGVSSTWAGIGGAGTQDLIQAGTQQITPPIGSLFAGGSYGAWYELLPANPVFFTGCSGDSACTVNPGDSMTTTITKGSGNTWTISVADSGHWTYSISVTYASSQSSAEWIHESPALGGVVFLPVGNSGIVTFDGTNTMTASGATRNIGASGATAFQIPVEATPSALDPSGDGFNVCTYALSCAPPTT
jgi:peptidase A4-like protein